RRGIGCARPAVVAGGGRPAGVSAALDQRWLRAGGVSAALDQRWLRAGGVSAALDQRWLRAAVGRRGSRLRSTGGGCARPAGVRLRSSGGTGSMSHGPGVAL
ncbi:MAG: hypothetical protein ACJ72O_17475, partial [Marmoricola sp.]